MAGGGGRTTVWQASDGEEGGAQSTVLGFESFEKMVVNIFTRGGLYPSAVATRRLCCLKQLRAYFFLGATFFLGAAFLAAGLGREEEGCVSGLVQVYGVTDGRCSPAHSP